MATTPSSSPPISPPDTAAPPPQQSSPSPLDSPSPPTNATLSPPPHNDTSNSPPPSNPPPPSPISPTPPVSSPPSETPPPPPSATPPSPPTSPPPSTPSPPASPPPSTPSPPASPPPPTPSPPASPPPPTPSPLASPPPPTPPSDTPTSPPSRSPPPPPSTPSPPPPKTALPPTSAPPPPLTSPNPPPPPTPSSSNSTPPAFSPPPPVTRLSPPPPPSRSGSPPSPTQNLTPPPPSNNSSDNSTPTDDGIGTAGIVAIGLGIGIIALSFIGIAFWCLKRRKKEAHGYGGIHVMPSPIGSSPRSDSSLMMKTFSSAPMLGSASASDFVYSPPSEPGELGTSRPLYTYEELVKATNGFSSQNLLGEGGFGSVYKGFLPDGREVAIKELKIGGGQGEREFRAEVEIISRIHHRHLVSLVGYCVSENHRLLIYEYVANDTLYFHIHGGSTQVLDWATRVKIAAGAARGIAYLHEDCHPRIFHRDIKSSNILLDNSFDARVSDFGLAKLAQDANTHITTRVMGTFGYVAPEYASSGKLTEKSDVYSFGVVLLELITGRKPVDASQPMGEESLVEWARPLLSHALENAEFEVLADPRLGTNYVESEMFRMVEAAAACVRHSSAKRPRMGQVVRAFDSFAKEDLTNGMRVGESEVYNIAQQSEEIRWFRRMAFGSQNYSSGFFSQDSS